MSYSVFIRREFFHDEVTVFIKEPGGYGKVRLLMDDGTWAEDDEGALPSRTDDGSPEPGWVLPYQAVEALYQAIKEFRGNALDSTTEAKVLREWLEVERSRVDKLIDGRVS